MRFAAGLFLVPILLAAAALASRYLSPATRTEPFPRLNQWGPVLAGLASAAFSLWTWGSLDAPAAIHDEAAYVLQARIFATGQWSAPSPPLPDFFRQFHVLLTPRLAPKYWPGHALFLVPSVAAGVPALTPIVLTGVAGGLLFFLARAVAGSAAAVLGFLIWLTAPGVAAANATYLTVTSSTTLWLCGAFFLHRWWHRGRVGDLVLLSLSAAGLAITRPLTAVAFAIPTLGALWFGFRRRGSWRHLVPAIGAGMAILAIVPLWSHSSTQVWWNPPYLAYRTVPSGMQQPDLAHSGYEAERFVPPDFRAYAQKYQRMRESHVARRLPRILAARIVSTLLDLFGRSSWRLGMIPFVALGFIALGPQGRFALAWPVALMLLHLPRPHFVSWSVYYIECLGFVAVSTGAGLCWLFQRISSQRLGRVHRASAVALSLALLASGVAEISNAGRQLRSRRAHFRLFESVLDQLPENQKSVVFVRYSEDHNVHVSLIRNSPDYGAEKHWIVYDRGDLNGSLLALAPDRIPYLFDEATFQLRPLR